ncbi:MAG: efflux RND transporter periplasmic adaptor subunit [Planctomycetota bacterium]
MRSLVVYLLTAVLAATAVYFGFPEWFESEASGAQQSGKARPAPPVVIARVVEAPFADILEALGTIRANESVELTANRADHVREVLFEDGDRAKENQLLVQLQDAEEQALLDEAEIRLKEATDAHERSLDLFGQGIDAQADLDGAAAQMQAAQSRVTSLTATIKDHKILAPFAGRLGLRQVSKGAFVEPSDVLTTLDDLSQVKIDFTIPGTRLAEVEIGQDVVVRSAAVPGREFRGAVRAIETRLDARTRSATIRALVPNNDELLRPGMLAIVEVKRGEAPVLQVPEEAVVLIGEKAFVWFVDAQDVVHRTEVRLGRRKVGSVEVLSGLVLDDRIVVEGLPNLVDGKPVDIIRERSNDA